MASRRERFAVLETVNPIVPKDTLIVESDTGRTKVGDGFKRYSELSYQSEGGSIVIPDTQATDAEVAAAIAAMRAGNLPGKELGYAERLTQDTTTSTPDDNPTLLNNLISGLVVGPIIGTGTPVDIEFTCGLVTHTVAAGVVYAIVMINDVKGPAAQAKLEAASSTKALYCKRRMVLTDGVPYTFKVAKSLDVAGTGTYYADNVYFPMQLIVTQR